MKRPRISDLAEAAGVSISTVDRVLNGRDPVSPVTAKRVLAAAERIGFRATSAIRQRLTETRPERSFGFVLQQRSSRFYVGLGDALAAATKAAPEIRGRARVEFLSDLSAASVADRLTTIGRGVDALAVVAADHPLITAAITGLRERGVPVFALISDLTAPGRAGYIGLDNWKVGRTAAWFVVQAAKSPGRVGILVGSHRYRCQDVCEMSFRSYFREHAPAFQLLEPVVSLEEERYAYEAMQDFLARTPDLQAIFLDGGGAWGAVRAIREHAASPRPTVIGLDLTDDSREGLIDGTITVMLNHPVPQIAEATVTAMIAATGGAPLGAPAEIVVPMEIQVAESI